MKDVFFDLKGAGSDVHKAAAALGIKTGYFAAINTGTPIDALPDETPVVKVWNSRKEITLTAGDVRYAHEYL